MADSQQVSAAQPKKILYCSGQRAAPTWYRCHVPGMELVRRGHEVILRDRFTQADIESCDVLVVQYQPPQGIDQMVAYANSLGKLTVFEVDDDLWGLHPSNPGYAFWNQSGMLEALARVVRACQAVTVPTQPLLTRMKTLNRNVRLLPNMLPDEHWPAAPKCVDHDPPIVVGWAGGSAHYPDLREIGPILLQLLDTYPNVSVRLAGAHPDWLPPHARLEFVPVVNIEDYAGLLFQFDIGVAPLEDMRFNESKSDLKVLEYSMIGLPVVASKVTSYVSTVKPGETGFLARNPKDWLRHLKNLIEDPALRSKVGAAAREWAETRTISRNIERWERVYGITEGQ